MSEINRPSIGRGFGFGGWLPRAIAPPHLEVDPASFGSADAYWMSRALLAAMEGVGRSNPNPTVGVVIVKDSKILAEGVTQRFGEWHAERVALAALSSGQALGATCYLTLEPCAGTGKQPPCVTALLAAGISRCVVGSEDPHPKAQGEGIRRLQAAGVEVLQGVLAQECRAWHFPFLAQTLIKRPVIIGKWAQTLDGQLADDFGQSQWISGAAARSYTHWLRQKYDAICVGIGTALADAPRLTVRASVPPHNRNPHKVILDPQGRLRQAPHHVRDALLEGLTEDEPKLFWLVNREQFEGLSWWPDAEKYVIPVLLRAGDEWPEMLTQLQQAWQDTLGRPLQSLLVEGGADVLTRLMRLDLLDALHVFVRAGILGGQRFRIGRLASREDGLTEEIRNPPRPLMDRHDFRLLQSLQLDQDVLLECFHQRFESLLWGP